MVTGYALEYSLAGSEVWSTVAENCHSLSHVVNGLQTGARYVFRVRAINIHGNSSPSAESDLVQLEEACMFQNAKNQRLLLLLFFCR